MKCLVQVVVARDVAANAWRDFYIPKHDVYTWQLPLHVPICQHLSNSYQLILQDMELYEKHVVLFGLKNLVPIAVVIDACNRTRKPVFVVRCFGKYMFKFILFFIPV